MTTEYVAVLGYVSSWLLGRFEPGDDYSRNPSLKAVTCAIKDGESPEAAAVRRIFEETGVKVTEHSVRKLGSSVRMPQGNVHLFAVALPLKSVDGKFEGEGWPDSYCQFVTQSHAIGSSDPLLVSLAARRIGL